MGIAGADAGRPAKPFAGSTTFAVSILALFFIQTVKLRKFAGLTGFGGSARVALSSCPVSQFFKHSNNWHGRDQSCQNLMGSLNWYMLLIVPLNTHKTLLYSRCIGVSYEVDIWPQE
jgi:hypothetical protein